MSGLSKSQKYIMFCVLITHDEFYQTLLSGSLRENKQDWSDSRIDLFAWKTTGGACYET